MNFDYNVNNFLAQHFPQFFNQISTLHNNEDVVNNFNLFWTQVVTQAT
jgi:hypothetical protein